MQLLVHNLEDAKPGNYDNHSFKTLYMIGDNPAIDINGARQVGVHWASLYNVIMIHWYFVIKAQYVYVCHFSGRKTLVFHFNENRGIQGKRKSCRASSRFGRLNTCIWYFKNLILDSQQWETPTHNLICTIDVPNTHTVKGILNITELLSFP